VAATQLPIEQGATEVPDRATFERLARRDDVPGALGAREMKFLMLGVDRPQPALFFLNTNAYQYHWVFATEVLGLGLSNADFNARTYFRDDRENLAGTIIAHDGFEPTAGDSGLYALEFWPTDPVRARHVAMAFDAVRAAMPFAAPKLAYHPAGDTQEGLFEEDEQRLNELGVRSVSTALLFANVSYVPLNLGEGYGLLRVFDPAGSRPLTSRDVALFTQLPNDLGHVAGAMSEAPQTPLSHVNLKAKQNDTPNAYVKGASTDRRVAPQIGKVVHYAVGPDTFTLEEASREQAETWLERVRPPHAQVPPRDLSVTAIADLDGIGYGSAPSVGAKAANVAELRKMLPNLVPRGAAIPFAFYDDFMRRNGFYDEAAAIVANVDILGDPAEREQRLTELRDRIRHGDLSDDAARAIADLHARFGPQLPLRCRSSTNNEDLKGFNGAGLYDSHTHRPDEGKLSKTVRQVWSSLWTFRGVDEREFHRIDHMAAAMGVLVHPNFDDELANGVAVTKNPFDPNWRGFYVNVQAGESLVTNPDPNATPDELLVSAIGEHDEWETQYIRHSSLAEPGKTVLTKDQISELTGALGTIQERFAQLYGAANDPAFAMDVEFKIDPGGQLVIKQARPWVD
jgi:pyruvate,water dikinase